jgi:acyl dehydratase
MTVTPCPVDLERLLAFPIPEIEHRYDDRDTMLYALGVGFGHDPADEQQLRYVWEQRLVATPTMAAVLGYPGFWMIDPESGVDWRQVVHAEQSIVIHEPIAATGTVVGTSRIVRVVDKGAGKAALIYTERQIVDAASGQLVATSIASSLVRGGGGFGSTDEPLQLTAPVPDTAPDLVCDLPTLPQSALLYRLSGDRNPLHVDPAVARTAGFDRPILHGLCTYGVVGHAILRMVCDYEPLRLAGLACRFSSPVYPGETIRTEMWTSNPAAVHFRASVPDRDVVVLDQGIATLAKSERD